MKSNGALATSGVLTDCSGENTCRLYKKTGARGWKGGGAEMDPGKWKSGGIDGRWLRGPNGHALSRGMIAPWFE